MIRIGLHPKAGLDFSAVTRYYRQQAGRDVAEPAVGPEGVRKKLLQGFPYAIHYAMHPGQVYILSLAHQRRAPEHIFERLRP